jgi:hypothetical protein|tara:strand:+ start:46 stop:207 length:162 start_codon:yes stop_codon:yes gene_type:complete
MHGCCKEVKIKHHIEKITVDKHTYYVTIVNCTTCGDVKATTNVRQIRHDKTKH